MNRHMQPEYLDKVLWQELRTTSPSVLKQIEMESLRRHQRLARRLALYGGRDPELGDPYQSAFQHCKVAAASARKSKTPFWPKVADPWK